jgi:endoglucanase
MIRTRIILLLFAACCFLNCKKKQTPVAKIPTRSNFSFAIPALSKGVNLSNWFNDYSDVSQYSTRFTASSFQNIKSLGFTCVRVPLGNTVLYNETNPSQLNAANLAKVDAGVKAAIDAGLGVIINLHPWKNDMDSLLAANAATVTKVATYWKAVAAYCKKYPADKLFFEVYNEPHASSGGLTNKPKTWWQAVQEQMVTAIRTETTDHYIIVGGEGWNSIEGLLLLQPYAAQKIIYNFHFYDPFLFTHQGATWIGWEPALYGRSIPYPSSPEAVGPVIAQSSNQAVKDAVNWYGSQRYNIDSLDKWVKQAANWAAQKNVLLICNEFGSYKAYAPRQSRLNYIKDVRTLLENNKIGWAMWEYDEGFGLIEYPGSNRNSPVIDREVAIALGLQ